MDYTKLEDVKEVLGQTCSEGEWNLVCDKVKKENNGEYPEWWFQEIILSGFGDKVMRKWGGSTEISIEPLDLSFFEGNFIEL